MKYTYPSDKRPDTSEDILSLGFISPSFDSVLVRVDSDPKINNDYLQLEIVSLSYYSSTARCFYTLRAKRAMYTETYLIMRM